MNEYELRKFNWSQSLHVICGGIITSHFLMMKIMTAHPDFRIIAELHPRCAGAYNMYAQHFAVLWRNNYFDKSFGISECSCLSACYVGKFANPVFWAQMI
jgi:hypothetical protein